ncbi:unnamed protein product [Lactuca virosa]|uniref:Dof zinc finger protein n=1 Tax=Lactuca virosa TaxID=75947 RepID=A0AAU9MI94_9ASTR|nr:unnamed protein product [Lactuca virosa]
MLLLPLILVQFLFQFCFLPLNFNYTPLPIFKLHRIRFRKQKSMHRDPSTFSSQMDMNPPFPEHEHLNCPRCNSSNTKFCYYNNYNLSQPRHFCKNCRRYWTKGGTLRNIPIGGGIRKATKRSSNPNKRTSPTTQQPPLPPTPAAAPPLPQKQQSCVVYGYDDFGSNFLVRLNGSNNPNAVREESSCWSRGENGWPDLSIFTPGSSFH